MDTKEIRMKALMTQEEFAEELGVSVSAVVSWEINKFSPNISSKRKIVEFCKKHGIEVRY